VIRLSCFIIRIDRGSSGEIKVFKKIYSLTGIKITAKDLRDYFASTIAMGSEEYTPDIVTVSELLGHTNLNTPRSIFIS